MKPLTIFLSVLTTLGIISCGQKSINSYQKSYVMRGLTTTTPCPLKFTQAGLCADIQWMNGPSADSESSFYITFWDTQSGSPKGPWKAPSAQVGSFIRMTCCGSIFFPTVIQEEPGKYLVSKVKFTPGKWEVYVQLRNGNDTEKQFITVNLDD